MESNEIYFRASSFGNLMTEAKGFVITEKQLETLKGYEDRHRGIGRPLTENQEKEMKDLIAKRDAPPQLSGTAKSEIEKIWLMKEKGYYDELENKFLTKGLMNEQTALQLVSDYLGMFLIKNDERVYKNNLTGEADSFFELEGKRIVVDTKCSWSAKTFMSSKLSPLYEYQLRAYMYLYDVDEAWLCYCLTDSPEHLVTAEKRKAFYKFYHDGMTNEEVDALEEKLKPMYEQIERNLVYSNNPAYDPTEMVKIFKISRDKKIEQEMLDKIKPALEYYQSIKLNQI